MPKISSSVLKTSIKRILYVLSTDYGSEQKKEFNILIALSAGQDSTCLCLFIIIYQKLIYTNKKIRVGIVHCQHNWDTFSLDKANHIDSWLILLKELGVEVTLYSSIPTKPTLTESTSRNWRLQLFDRISKKNNYNILFTGHTLNDEVETFLMQQLIRGFFPRLVNDSGSKPLPAKPLTWIYRNEILHICKYWQFPVFADVTNSYILLPRSRIRLELFSILKALYNPQIENSLKQTIQIQKETYYSLKEQDFAIHLFCNKDRIVLNRLKINQLPLLTQKNLWRQCFEALGVFNIGFYWIEKCLFYSQTKKEFIFSFIKGIQLKGSANLLILSKNQN